MSGAARLARQLKDFWLRRERPAAPPFRLWVDITSRCNLACPACPQRLLEDGQRADMPGELLESLAGQVGGLGSEVNLFHRGEPLLRPDLGAWIERFREGGARLIRLHSNATLLDGARISALLAQPPDILTLSVDSLDGPAYAAARPGADLGRTLDGVERLLRSRGAGQPPRLTLLLMGPQNWGPEAKANLDRLKALGLERVLARRPHNWGGALAGTGQAAAPLPPRSVCTFPWYGLAVLSDGRVCPCPQDFFGQMALGRAGEAPLLDIWQGQAARDLRRAQAAGRLEAYPVCRACDRIQRRSFLGLPTEHLKNLLVESIVSSPGRRGSRPAG
ncbi:MAG: SPASM domain-containing protein [Desulfarculus sp.]|nr:SPASM domain-containing protein [Desulfarculus sp.]